MEVVFALQSSCLRVTDIYFTGPFSFDSAAGTEPLATGTGYPFAVRRKSNRLHVRSYAGNGLFWLAPSDSQIRIAWSSPPLARIGPRGLQATARTIRL